MGHLFHWESKRMKNLQQIQAEENRELKAMIVVVPIAVLVFLYLAIGVAVTVTQRWFSPCSPYATRTYDRDFERTNALRGVILPVILWGPRFVEHVVQEDMPMRHFIFASDCQWSAQLPEPQRLFARAAGDKTCPPGTNEVRGQRCKIPYRDGEPIQLYLSAGLDARCPTGWLRFPERGTPFLACRLPSLAKPGNGHCPSGFTAWRASPDRPNVRTVVDGLLPYPASVEVCRLSSS
jgi:hypothetical protein